MSKLEEICAHTREELHARQQHTSLSALEAQAAAQSAPRGFEAALRARVLSGTALIAEIKKASPSKGLIRADFAPASHARAYEQGGAACLSVLTDAHYFQGASAYLIAARAASSLPVLRKDFMIDPWQVLEARAMGADAILIILAALDEAQAHEIEAAAGELGMDVLVETHTLAEMERAHHLRSRLIGINNRDLQTFTTDLGVSETLAARAPEGALIVAESGIATHADCQRLGKAGIRAFLVGESLMRCADIEAGTRALLCGSSP